MKILITAGGTKEKIDDVRYIANHSTGQLGATIADAFANSDCQVTYIHGYGALTPTSETIKTIEIFSAADLATALEQELTKHTYHAVIHSMAVSDYTVANTFSQKELVTQLAAQLVTNSRKELEPAVIEANITTLLSTLGINNTDKKLSSDNEHLLLRLKKNPKIIGMIKKWQPNTLLVGFKLLVDVSDKQLIEVATRLLEKNQCDYVLANDLTTVSSHSHRGLLIGPHNFIESAQTKQEIAQKIVTVIKNRKDEY